MFRRFSDNVLSRWALAGAAIVLGVLAAGQITARNRDWHDDFTFLSNTLAVEPHASYLRSDFGVLEWNRGRAQEAEGQWRLAIADKTDNVIALSNLGMAMLEKKDYPAAESFLEQAIALRPQFAEPHIHLAGVYAARGDQVRAEAELRKAVEIYPLSTQGRNALGKLLFDAGRIAEAEVQYRASVDSLPNPDGWNGLGDIYLREGEPQKAEAAWREVLRLSNYDTHAHVSLGNLYFASRREAEAEKEYRFVLLFDPHQADALRAMRKLHPSEFPASMP